MCIRDRAETAKLIANGTPVARLNTGIDGGMNKVFASKLQNGSTGLSEGGDGQDVYKRQVLGLGIPDDFNG